MAGYPGQRTNVCLLAELSAVLKVCRVSAFTPTLCPSRWEITAACCSPSKTLLTTAASRTRSGHWLAAMNTFCNLCWLHYYFQSPLKTCLLRKLNVLSLAAYWGKQIYHKAPLTLCVCVCRSACGRLVCQTWTSICWIWTPSSGAGFTWSPSSAEGRCRGRRRASNASTKTSGVGSQAFSIKCWATKQCF